MKAEFGQFSLEPFFACLICAPQRRTDMFYPHKGSLVHTLHGVAELIKQFFQANGHFRYTAKGDFLLQAVMVNPSL